MTRRIVSVVALAALCAVTTGCMPKMTIEEMKAMMPQRPAELDKLEMFMGNWASTGEAEMAGIDRKLATKGSSSVTWECDRWYLAERGEFEIEEFGKGSMLALWTYDTKAKVYRMYWFDSHGGFGQGTAKHCEKSNTWTMKAKSKGAMGTSVGHGTAKYLDANTMEWTWGEWDSLQLMKFMEMKGVNKKQ